MIKGKTRRNGELTKPSNARQRKKKKKNMKPIRGTKPKRKASASGCGLGGNIQGEGDKSNHDEKGERGVVSQTSGRLTEGRQRTAIAQEKGDHEEGKLEFQTPTGQGENGGYQRKKG